MKFIKKLILLSILSLFTSCRVGVVQWTAPTSIVSDQSVESDFEGWPTNVTDEGEPQEPTEHLETEPKPTPALDPNDPTCPPDDRIIWVENDQQFNRDFFGSFTVVASCWDGRLVEAWEETSSLHPSVAIGMKVTYSENKCFVNGIERGIPDYTSLYYFPPHGGSVSEIGWYSAFQKLALSLDLSAKYRSRWENMERPIHNIYQSDTEFPEDEKGTEIHSNIIQVVHVITIIDENHLLLGDGTWDVLAVRDSHLEDGCNYFDCRELTTVFDGDAYRHPYKLNDN